MKNIKLLTLLAPLILSLGLWSSCTKETKTGGANKDRYEANWKSLKKYEPPQWFKDAKLGIFIHWGPYSVPAFGSEWYPRLMYMDSVVWNPKGEIASEKPSYIYKHHVETWGDPGEFGYKDFIPMFTGEKFNAQEWINLFKKSGAKYVVPVAEHHDGFAMYNSNVTRWNSVDMGPKKDILGELAKTARAEGLKLGASSHFAFNWNYYNQKEGFDTMDPEYFDLYGRPHEHYAPADEEFLRQW